MSKRTDPLQAATAAAQHPLEAALLANWPADRWHEVTVLVAVSGGADSVALLRALVQLAGRSAGCLVVAHYNHRWRAGQAEADAAFVAQLAASLGLACHTGQAPPGGPPPTEQAARTERYRFLHHTAGQVGARFLATAHTADDQVETVLFRLLRGTGIRGLAGIPRLRPLDRSVSLIRPLLDVTGQQTRQYLQALGQTWREDGSNYELHFSRARIRHQLLPLLESQYHPAVRENLLRLARSAAQAEEMLQQQLGDQLRRSLAAHQPGRQSQVRFFPDQSLYLRCEMLRDIWRQHGWPLGPMTQAHWLKMAQATGDAVGFTLPGAIRARHQADGLQLEAPTHQPPAQQTT